MDLVARSLEWFEFFDEITKTVAARQVWTVMPYTNYAFVIWHFDLASQQNCKLSYPTTVTEVRISSIYSMHYKRYFQVFF